MEMEVGEDLESFKKLAAKEAKRLRLLIQQANSDVADDDENVDLEEEAPNFVNYIHADTEILLHDDGLFEFGTSFCRLRESAIRDFILFACFAFPDCIPDRLRPIAKFSIWLFYFDDFFDDAASTHSLAADPGATAGFVEEVLSMATGSGGGGGDIYRGMDMDRAVVEESAAGLATWWREMKELGMPPPQQRRFLDAFLAYAASVVQQTRYTSSATFPADIRSYAALRADASLMHCFMVLVEFSLGVDLMSDFAAGPLGVALDGLRENAVMELVWFNDLRSFAKEMAEGDCMNLIPYVYVKEFCGGGGSREGELDEEGVIGRNVEAALNMAVHMILTCRQERRRLETQILDQELSVIQDEIIHKENIRRYVKAIRRMVAGLEKWHDAAVRYAEDCPALVTATN